MVAETVVVGSRSGGGMWCVVGQQPMIVVEIVVVATARTTRTSVEQGHREGRQWRDANSPPSVALRVWSGLVVGSRGRRDGSGSDELGDLATSFELIVGNQMTRRRLQWTQLGGRSEERPL